MKTAIIGDIHGCYDVLLKLLIKLNLNSGDMLIFLGDLIHKGPDSKAVVELVMHLQAHAKYTVKCIKGNHEERQVRYEYHEKLIKEGKRKSNPMKHTEGYDNLKLSDRQIQFLEDLPYYYQFKLNDHMYICLHGGISSRLKSLRLPQNPKQLKHITNSLMRLRYESPTGRMVPFGKEAPQDNFWAEIYDGRFGHAFFGHQPFKKTKPVKFKHATGLDLGCPQGNYLAAAVIKNKQINYITVPNPKKYCDFYHRSN